MSGGSTISNSERYYTNPVQMWRSSYIVSKRFELISEYSVFITALT